MAFCSCALGDAQEPHGAIVSVKTMKGAGNNGQRMATTGNNDRVSLWNSHHRFDETHLLLQTNAWAAAAIGRNEDDAAFFEDLLNSIESPRL
jgi:hypothetical protein